MGEFGRASRRGGVAILQRRSLPKPTPPTVHFWLPGIAVAFPPTSVTNGFAAACGPGRA
ncbi:hypothetical protein CBM2589_U10226 [Cupriavidus taiwanensis]|uniref:Uncharacterized protein n=1 Tax=Cupriavidus taiwanensis TaxID=164546 RepID=A0A375CQN1_9BURK|nr:hypothetical protein CBM2589_U10226 [Cupriavidus taiwanensis]